MSHGERLWPVFASLLAAVIVPTACVLWFMTQAIRNERLALRQKLVDIHRPTLARLREQVGRHWRARLDELVAVTRDASPAEAFAKLVREGRCDGAVVYGEAGRVLYPSDPTVGQVQRDPAAWAQAVHVEHHEGRPDAAAELYASIAKEVAPIGLAARALQAQARCLAKAGKRDEAIALLTDRLTEPKYRDAVDPQGRSIRASAALLALNLINDPGHPKFRPTLAALVEMLNDYASPTMPSSQRRFLMQQVSEIAPASAAFAACEAEELTAQYLAAKRLPPNPGAAPGIWPLSLPEGKVVVLFTARGLADEIRPLIASERLPLGCTVEILPPARAGVTPEPLLAAPLCPQFPDWRLAICLDESGVLSSVADRQITAYLWTGVLVILFLALLALLAGRYISKQMWLTRLKNDLIANVTHELKTPLTSMRVLVDTLREGRCRGPEQAQEYFELISKENERLSHLIDSFLAFSRMERNKQAFQLDEIDVAEAVQGAVDAAGEKLAVPDCRLDLEIADSLPPVRADRNALVTAVLNLLDNAHKYTEGDKHIVVRACEADGRVCMSVQDNGPGLSSRDRKRIFERFYRADDSLTRKVGGSGLGLSIVKFIVDAHQGVIAVDSVPGQGSTFTISLPVSRHDERPI